MIDQLFWYTGAGVWLVIAAVILAIAPTVPYMCLLLLTRGLTTVSNKIWLAGGGTREKAPDGSHELWSKRVLKVRNRVAKVADWYGGLIEKIGY